MSLTIADQHFEFKCRKCGRKRTARFTVPYPVKKSEAAKRVGYKNTSHGAQCVDEDGGCALTYRFAATLRAIAAKLSTCDASELEAIAQWHEEHQ